MIKYVIATETLEYNDFEGLKTITEITTHEEFKSLEEARSHLKGHELITQDIIDQMSDGQTVDVYTIEKWIYDESGVDEVVLVESYIK